MRAIGIVGALGALGLALGCSHGENLPQGTGGSGEYFVLHGEGGANEANLSNQGISGPNVQVSRYKDEMRGEAYGHTVQIMWSGNEVRGSVAGAPVDLKVEQQGDVLHIRGLYEGHSGHLVIKPGEINGNIGLCQYSMRAGASGRYEGNATCGGYPERATLALPPMLASFPPAGIAAHLAVFLGR